MPLTPRAADLDHFEFLAEEAAAREEAEIGPVCAGCGERSGPDPFYAAADEPYCPGCALQLTAHVARGAIPHGGTAADPDSLTIITGRWS